MAPTGSAQDGLSTLCAASNHITKFNQPEWIAHRDFAPIVPSNDNALLEYARARRVAAE